MTMYYGLPPGLSMWLLWTGIKQNLLLLDGNQMPLTLDVALTWFPLELLSLTDQPIAPTVTADDVTRNGTDGDSTDRLLT